jgi:amino acid adenylation domain-containing protein
MSTDSSFHKVQIDSVHPYTPFNDEEIEQSIPKRFEQKVLESPNRLAVKSPERSFTYDDLNQTANRLARKILSLRGERVEAIALLFDHGASILAAMLGVLKTGKFYLVLDPTYPPDRLAYMLADSGADLVITDTKNLSLVSELTKDGKEAVNMEDLDDSISTDNLDFYPVPDALAMLVYTSGSTANPKGAMHSHQSVLVEVRNLTNAWCISSQDHWLLYTSMSFANSVRTIYGALLNGGSVYPYDLKEYGFSALPDWLLSNRITILRTLPTTFRNFMATLPSKLSFPDVRILSIGGEPMLQGDVDLFNRHFAPPCVIVHGMGPTECFMVCLIYIPHGTHIDESKLAIGWPARDKEVLLLDESGREVQVGEVGEICVKSRYISLGYWNDPDRTRAAFLRDPLDSTLRIYRTGDLGIRAENGCLTHVGRVDFQVKIRGFRIDVSEIEVALRAIDGIKDAVVVGREDSVGEKRLVAYFVASTAPAITATQIRKSLARVIPDYMIPSAFVCLEAIPLTPNGKTDRLRLPLPSHARPKLDVPFAAPTTTMEKDLSTIWSEVLVLDTVGIHDNFFDLGGNSLLATKVAVRVLKELKVEIALKTLFKAPTIAQLAAEITERDAGKISDGELIALLDQIESLSDEEVQRWLVQDNT